MVRTRTLHGTAPWCCAVLLAGSFLATPAARAQSTVIARPVPGLAGLYDAEIRQVTRDGTRILVAVGSTGPGRYILVLETDSGMAVFDSRPVQSHARSYSTAALSPDGEWISDVEFLSTSEGPASDVRVTRLSTGEGRVAFHVPKSPVSIHTVADGATRVGVYDPYIMGAGYFGVGGSGQPLRRFTAPCPPGTSPDPPALDCTRYPLSMSADGAHVAFKAGWVSTTDTLAHYAPMVGDVSAERSTALAIDHADLSADIHPPLPWRDVKMSGDGDWVGCTGRTRAGHEPRAVLVHRTSGRAIVVAEALGRTYFHDVSDDGRAILLTGDYSPASGQPLRVVDRLTGLVWNVLDPLDVPLGRYRVLSAHLSGDGRTIVATLGDGASSDSTPRRTFIARLKDMPDADADGMDDRWETTFGLDPSSATDAGLDPDNDGRTSAQEYADGTHPRGTPVRYFAEGASGAFFATSLALFNPTDATVTANVRFLGADGAAAAMPVSVPAHGPAYLDADEAQLPFTEFSIVVESPVPIVAERRVTWDRTRRYGSHASSGVPAPSVTWHFAEGATIAGMQTFFLLHNPGATPATVSMRYLLSSGAVERRLHVVPPESRRTVWVNREGGPLGGAEFATIAEADVPIVAERALYRDAPGELFAAGSAAAGTPAPARSFLFAEGATGPLFDTYLLVSNPGDTPADVTVVYQRPFSPNTWTPPIVRGHVVAPHSRLTIWVAHEAPELRNTAVSAWVSSMEPTVAERAMWWPGPTEGTWAGSHAELGATRAAFTWVAADLSVADAPESTDAFLLLSTLGSPAQPWVVVSLSCADGTRASRQYVLPWTAADWRTTLWLRPEFPELTGRRCAAVVESLPVDHNEGYPGTTVRYPVYLVVESAVYGGHVTSGTAALATPLP